MRVLLQAGRSSVYYTIDAALAEGTGQTLSTVHPASHVSKTMPEPFVYSGGQLSIHRDLHNRLISDKLRIVA
jgi:hypothetical protein